MARNLNPWPQDAIARPTMSTTAAEDPLLRTLDKAQYVIPWVQPVTNAGGLFYFRYTVQESNNFVMSTLNVVSFIDATQLEGGLPGFITVMEDANQNPFISDLPIGLFGTPNPATGGYRRSLWALPYPIGAGGGFLASLSVPANSAGDITLFITFDGWKDYTLGKNEVG